MKNKPSVTAVLKSSSRSMMRRENVNLIGAAWGYAPQTKKRLHRCRRLCMRCSRHRQKSTVPETSKVRGAPKPPERPLPSPPFHEPSQYALLVTFCTVARRVTGLVSTLKA